MKRIFSLIIVLAIVLSAFSVIPVSAADEIFSLNFEKDGGWSPWSTTGGDLNTITTEAYSEGSKALYMADDSDTLTAGIKTDRISVTPGETYTALCDFYLVSGNLAVYFRFYDANGKQISSKSGTGKQKTWVNVAISDTAPEAAVTCDVVIASVKVSKAFGYVDNIKVVKGKVAASAISGAKSPAATASESTSTATTTTTTVAPNDDGVKDGTLLHSHGFENGLSPWKYQTTTSEEYVFEITDTASEGSTAINVNDSSSDAGPGITSEKIPVSQGNE